MADVEAVPDGAVARLTSPVPEPPAPSASPAPAADEMTLVDHLVELRDRLIPSVARDRHRQRRRLVPVRAHP